MAFFFNDTASTEIYTLSLHDALPILEVAVRALRQWGITEALVAPDMPLAVADRLRAEDRKSTRLNSSHANISYAVFCLKKKTSQYTRTCTGKLPSLYRIHHHALRLIG